MPRKEYANLSIPKELVIYIDMVIKSGKFGYRSRADFVTDAIRRRLEELGYYPKKLD